MNTLKIEFPKPAIKVCSGVRLTEDSYNKVKQIARENNTTMRSVIRVFVEAMLAEYEKEQA